MGKNKVNKTFTIEEETIKIIENYMKEKNLSSYSSTIERILIEWVTLKENKINIDDIVKKVLDKLSNDKLISSLQNNESKDNNKNIQNSLINNIFDEMPE